MHDKVSGVVMLHIEMYLIATANKPGPYHDLHNAGRRQWSPDQPVDSPLLNHLNGELLDTISHEKRSWKRVVTMCLETFNQTSGVQSVPS